MFDLLRPDRTRRESNPSERSRLGIPSLEPSPATHVILVGTLLVLGSLVAVSSAATAQAPDTCDIEEGDRFGCVVRDGTSWLDTSEGVTLALGTDDVAGPIDIGFDFPWYNGIETQTNISTKGLVCFTNNDCDDLTAQPVPDPQIPNDLAACFWEDLEGSYGTVRYNQTETPSGQQAFIVEYSEVPHFGTTTTNTFQIQLLETGTVRCQLQDVTDDGDDRATAVGTENGTGEGGVRYTFSSFSAQDVEVAFVLPPKTPTNLTATEATTELVVDLDWDHPKGDRANYNVSLRGSGLVKTGVQQTNTTHDLSGLDPSCGETFTYNVTAVLGPFESDPSNPANLTLDCPSEPRNVSAEPTGTDNQNIEIAWNVSDSSGSWEIDHYNLEYCQTTTQACDPGTILDEPTGTSLVDESVGQGKRRCYNVSAENPVGSGPTNGPACAVTIPGTPSDLGLEALPNGTVEVNWSALSDQVVSTYEVYRDGTLLSSVSSSVAYDEQASVTGGQQACYQVAARNDAGEGNQTAPECLGTPDAVEELAASGGVSTTLTWGPPRNETPPSDADAFDLESLLLPPVQDGGAPITAYHVYRCRLDGAQATDCEAGSQPTLVGTVNASDGHGDAASPHQRYVFEDAPPEGGWYSYRVHAVNNLGEGAVNATEALVVDPTSPVPEVCPFPPGEGTVEACLEVGDEIDSFGVTPGNGTTHRVVGTIDRYSFAPPTGGTVDVPCVNLTVDGTRANPCELAGGTFQEHTLTLVDREVDEPTAGEADTVRVCEATLTARVAGFGVGDLPVAMVC